MTIDPMLAAVVVPIWTAIAAITTRWIDSKFALIERDRASKLEIDSLKAALLALEKKNADLEAQKLALMEYQQKHLTREAIKAKYQVDPITGDLVKDELHFCSKCFHEDQDPPKEVQMAQPRPGLFRCTFCQRSIDTVPKPHITKNSTTLEF